MLKAGVMTATEGLVEMGTVDGQHATPKRKEKRPLAACLPDWTDRQAGLCNNAQCTAATLSISFNFFSE
jgi:hypothetical protein